MANTLQDQLYSIPIQRLTTVLRVDLPLSNPAESFQTTQAVIDAWWRDKAKGHGLSLDSPLASQVFANERCRADVGYQENAFALVLEEIQPRPTEARDWITDVALTVEDGCTRMKVRLSYRQPHHLQPLRAVRAPRFLREIVELGFAMDGWPLASTARTVGQNEFPAFLSILNSTTRTLPVVVVSEDWPGDAIYTDVDLLAQLLAGAAHVVRLKSEATWRLSGEFGQEWSTFKGAVRCYNPKLDLQGDKYKHRLWLADAIRRSNATARDEFTNACVRHVFTQLNAEFESQALLTPSALRRNMEERAPASLVSIPTSERQALLPGIVSDRAATLEQVEEAQEFPREAELLLQLQEQAEALHRLTLRNEQLADSLAKTERDFQEERKSHADTRKSWYETQGMLQLYEEKETQEQEVSRWINGDSSHESSEALRPMWEAIGPFLRSLRNVSTHLRTVEEDLSAEQRRLMEAERERDQYRGKSMTLEGRLQATPRRVETEIPMLADFLPRMVVRNPSLLDILEAVQTCFPERIVVLSTARASAEQSAEFLRGLKAFDLLWRLATDYWQQLQSGGGDALARNVFGESYSPRESEKLSKGGAQSRTFEYDGQPVLMEKHLKIGSADNAAETLRIHFHWASDEKRIIIGHCGCHLDF